MSEHPILHWTEAGVPQSARWRAESGAPPPKRVRVADDTLTADAAYRLACEGTAVLWRGDFHNAKQLLQAMARRADAARGKRMATADAPLSPRDAWNRYRLAQSQRARTLAMLLIPFAEDYGIPLRRAPDLRFACREAWGVPEPDGGGSVASLRELLGIVGAHEWRRNGVAVAALGDRLHPHYGVFAPIRGDYVGLVAETPLPVPVPQRAFDVGTGTGVLAAVLARRGIAEVVATDLDPRALACARENIVRLGVQDQVTIEAADLFPTGRAGLIVCNPPWLPARPSSALEHAIYDPESRMLRGFLSGLGAHLEAGGMGWLILSDLAEHLGLRSREALLDWIAAAGLVVVGRLDARPTHQRARDTADLLHTVRTREITSLWQLQAAG